MSKSYLPVGIVTPTGQDVLPSTGAHLDVRVWDPGANKYLNPETIRSLLTRLKVGKNRTPLWQQKGDDWVSSFPITSGYGSRSAPTEGASTFHPANDYGVPGGTELAWEGPGKFKPGKGYGEIETTDAGGRPFVVKLLHTKGGKEGGLAAMPTTPQTVTPTGEIINNYFFGGMSEKSDPYDAYSFLKKYLSKGESDNRLTMEDLIGMSAKPTSPVEQVASILSQKPQFYG